MPNVSVRLKPRALCFPGLIQPTRLFCLLISFQATLIGIFRLIYTFQVHKKIIPGFGPGAQKYQQP